MFFGHLMFDLVILNVPAPEAGRPGCARSLFISSKNRYRLSGSGCTHFSNIARIFLESLISSRFPSGLYPGRSAGCRPVIICNIVAPKPYTSVLVSTRPFLTNCSGAANPFVPIGSAAIAAPFLPITAAPKSTNFTWPAGVTIRFPGFKSR